jgi:hypothetical protein
MRKCNNTKKSYSLAHAEWRATLRKDSFSPAELFCKRILYTAMLRLSVVLGVEEQKTKQWNIPVMVLEVHPN